MLACSKGNVEMTNLLLQHIDYSSVSTGEDGEDGEGPRARARARIASDFEQNMEGNTAMHLACTHGSEACVRALLRCPARKQISIAEAFLRNRNGMMPLHVACEMGHVDVVRELLKIPGVLPHASPYPPPYPFFPYPSPPSSSAYELFLMGLRGGIYARAEPDLYTPLILASKTGRASTVALLLEQPGGQGADLRADFKGGIHATDVDGMTALHWACKTGNDRVAHHLVEAGASLHARTDVGDSALDICTQHVSHAHARIASLLLYRKERQQSSFALSPLPPLPSPDILSSPAYSLGVYVNEGKEARRSVIRFVESSFDTCLEDDIAEHSAVELVEVS